MACGGHCNVCPAHPGYDPPLDAVQWNDDGLGSGIPVKGFHFYNLAWYVDYEMSRRNKERFPGWFVPITQAYFGTEDVIYASDYWILYLGVNVVSDGWSSTWCTTQYLSAGAFILDESTNEMRTQINTLRTECLCDCNYACTCNCNYCTCNCNYACTCNCNYSDRRLKTDIKYL